MGYYERWRQMIPESHWASTDPGMTAFYQALAQQADDLIAAIHAGMTWISPVDADADGLARWEALLLIGADGTLEERRARVIARLADYGTIRTEVLEAIAQAFGATVVIEEVPAEYKFVVHFRNPLGEPPYVNELRAVYDEVKRATWQYEFSYTFRLWSEWTGKSWGQLKAAGITWLDMQAGDPSSV